MEITALIDGWQRGSAEQVIFVFDRFVVQGDSPARPRTAAIRRARRRGRRTGHVGHEVKSVASRRFRVANRRSSLEHAEITVSSNLATRKQTRRAVGIRVRSQSALW